MVEAVVEYEYTAQEEDELSLKPGDIISDVNKTSGGWWEGVLNGKRGVFPDNFVKEHVKPKEKGAAPDKTKRSSHVAGLANKLEKEGGIKVQGPKSMGQTKKADSVVASIDDKRLKATVKFAYEPTQDDELKLEIGEIVDIIKQEEEGWWEGSVNGHTGLFPTNFVELIKDGDGDGAADTSTSPEGSEIKGKKIKGVGLGDIFKGGHIKLRSTQDEGEEKAPARQAKATRAAPPPLPQEPPALPPKDGKTGSERARVLYSYQGENDDELTLEEGENIIILEKELEDVGWWRGQIGERTGVFPDNFVELIVDEKPKKPPPPAVPPNSSRPRLDTKTDPPRLPKKEEPKGMKKPAMPPPVGKKPSAGNKSADSSLIAQTDDQKAREQKTDNLDQVESNEKLSHITASRAKAPQRRPPSSIKAKTEVAEIDEGPPLDEPPPVPAPLKEELFRPEAPANPSSRRKAPRPVAPPHREDKTPDVEPVESVRVSRPAPPTPIKEDSLKTPAPSVQVNGVGVSLEEFEQLRDELSIARNDLQELRANSVPRSQFDELRTEMQSLRDMMAQMKTQTNKRIVDLMNEIDEEKKIRLNTQVEIERIKKLTLNMNS